MFSIFIPVIYIQISPERIVLRNLKTGESLAEAPELAISPEPGSKVLAAGARARAAAASQPAKIINPFAHPRSLASDFIAAEQLIRHLLRRVLGNSLLSPAPRVVIHPLGSPDGGFTQVERRAFREMVRGAGASEVRVWTGRPLADQEILAKRLPAGGGEWE